MKKIFYLILAGVLMAGISSCNSNPVDEPENGGNSSEEQPTPTTADGLTISISNVTDISAYVSVVPADTDKYYMFAYDTYENYTEYGYVGNDEFAMKDDFHFWANDYWSYYEDLAKEHGYDFYSFLLSKGNIEGNLEDLDPSTEYIAYAYYVEINGADTTLSGLTYKKFTTEKAQTSSITFQIDVDGADVTIKPSNNDPYWYTVLENELLYDEEYGYGGDLAEALKDDYVWLSYFYEDIEPITGVENFELGDFAYEAGEYTILVAGFNGHYVTSDIVSKEVTITDDMIPDDEDDDFESPRKANKKKAVKQLKTTKHRLVK